MSITGGEWAYGDPIHDKVSAAVKRQRQGGFLIAKIHQLAGRIFNRMLRDHGIKELNTAQGRIMFVLWRNDGIAVEVSQEMTRLFYRGFTGEDIVRFEGDLARILDNLTSAESLARR